MHGPSRMRVPARPAAGACLSASHSSLSGQNAPAEARGRGGWGPNRARSRRLAPQRRGRVGRRVGPPAAPTHAPLPPAGRIPSALRLPTTCYPAGMGRRLWHDPDVRTFLAGRTVSEIGSRITREGLPIVAILLVGATAPQLGLLAALSSVAAMVAALGAGVVVDRRRRRPLMIACDVARAALLCTIPVAAFFHRLTFVQIAVVTGLTGAVTVLFDVADQAWLPQFVSRARLHEGNALVAAASAGGETGGPALMGALFQWVGGPVAILFDAVSYLASAASLLAIRRREPPPAPAPAGSRSAAREAVAGVRAVFRHPLLRPLALTVATQSLFGGFHGALYELYALRALHLDPLALGILITAGGAGAMAGSAAAHRLARRVGTGPALVWAGLGAGLLSWLVPFAHGPRALAFAALLGAQLAGDAASAVFRVNEATLRQSVTPDAWLGRVTGSGRWLGGTASAVGALAAGALGAVLGLRAALCVYAAGLVLAPLWLWFSGIRTVAEAGGPEPGTAFAAAPAPGAALPGS